VHACACMYSRVYSVWLSVSASVRLCTSHALCDCGFACVRLWVCVGRGRGTV